MSETVYKKVYSKFGGVDFTNPPTDVDDSRSPDSVNMINSYIGTPERRTGFKNIVVQYGTTTHTYDNIDWEALRTDTLAWNDETDNRINGIHTFVNKNDVKKLVVHVGKRFFLIESTNSSKSFDPDSQYTKITQINNKSGNPVTSARNGRSMSFQQTKYTIRVENKNTVDERIVSDALPRLYILDGKNFYVFSGGKLYVITDEDIGIYVPFTMIGATPEGGSDSGEPANLLSPYRRNSFFGDGSSKTFNLDATDITSISTVQLNGVVQKSGTDYTVDKEKGTITFNTAPPKKNANEKPNIYVMYKKIIEGDPIKIKKCKICARTNLDNQSILFISGNSEYPNYEWYNEVPYGNGEIGNLPDPTYWPDSNFNVLGDERTAIKGYSIQYGNIVTVKEGNGVDASMYYKTDTSDENGNVVFANTAGIAGIGASSAYSFASLLDDPLFLSSTGVYGLDSNAVTQQKTIQTRSYYVDRNLRQEANKRDACACVCNNYYYLFFPNGHCYVADGIQKSSNITGSFGYEWYYWDVDIKPRTCAMYCPTQREVDDNTDTGLSEMQDRLLVGTEDGKLLVLKLRSEGMNAYYDEFTKDVKTSYTSKWSTKEDTLTDASSYKKILKQNIGVYTLPMGKAYAKVYYKDDKEKKIKREIDLYQNEDFLEDFLTLETKTKEIKNPLYVYSASKDIDKYISASSEFNFDLIDFNNVTFGDYATSKFVPTKKKYRKARKFQIIIVAEGDSAIGTNFGISEIHLKYKIKGRIKR